MPGWLRPRVCALVVLTVLAAPEWRRISSASPPASMWASAATSCLHFQQTANCEPAGRRESRMSCDTEIGRGMSGFCVCGGASGAPSFDVTCDHEPFVCRDACEVAERKRQHDQKQIAGAPFAECAWRQSGGCTPTGPREPHSDKVGASVRVGLQLCGVGRGRGVRAHTRWVSTVWLFGE